MLDRPKWRLGRDSVGGIGKTFHSPRRCGKPPAAKGDQFVTSRHLLVPICFSVLLFISGCSIVGGDVQAGRNALQTGHPNDALGYLTRAAEVDPNYKIPY